MSDSFQSAHEEYFSFSSHDHFRLSEAGICIYSADNYYHERVVYDYELVFVTDGRLVVRENDQLIHLEKNQGYIFFPRTTRLRGSVPVTKGTTYFWLHFTFAPTSSAQETGLTFWETNTIRESKTCEVDPGNRAVCCQWNERGPVVPCGQQGSRLRIPRFTTPRNPDRLAMLLKWYIQDYMGEEQQEHYHDMLFQFILQEFSKTSLHGPEDQFINPMVSMAYQYIMNNFSKDLSVQDLAVDVGCNPDYLTKLFKQTFGKPVIRFINDIRIEHAKHLLVTTNKQIKQIAAECGYNSDIHFRQTFKKMEGITPKEYQTFTSKARINPN